MTFDARAVVYLVVQIKKFFQLAHKEEKSGLTINLSPSTLILTIAPSLLDLEP